MANSKDVDFVKRFPKKLTVRCLDSYIETFFVTKEVADQAMIAYAEGNGNVTLEGYNIIYRYNVRNIIFISVEDVE